MFTMDDGRRPTRAQANRVRGWVTRILRWAVNETLLETRLVASTRTTSTLSMQRTTYDSR